MLRALCKQSHSGNITTITILATHAHISAPSVQPTAPRCFAPGSHAGSGCPAALSMQQVSSSPLMPVNKYRLESSAAWPAGEWTPQRSAAAWACASSCCTAASAPRSSARPSTTGAAGGRENGEVSGERSTSAAGHRFGGQHWYYPHSVLTLLGNLQACIKQPRNRHMAAHNVAAHSAYLPPGAGHPERPQGCATRAAQARWLVAQHVARRKLLGRVAAAPTALAGQRQQRRAGHAGPTPCKQLTPHGKAAVERLIANCMLLGGQQVGDIEPQWLRCTHPPSQAHPTTNLVACSLPSAAAPGVPGLRWCRRRCSSRSPRAVMAGKAAPPPSLPALCGSASSCSRPCNSVWQAR